MLTEEGFGKMTQFIRDLAQTFCGDKLVSVLEGGYNLQALAHSAAAHVEALI
jgi:acetoin utilization deacetylase AcuC-like enzyme